ncbi:LacI family DNA-binding transcriptional regulator [Salisediminibacterium selenitireducens]|uniref:Transcriptional regulator, LacI family n=1 Tax=Bacillus selenitireducens (strain ATCC 700615 / DSM 15326 / MLS10) TaxID=439292 RepID=D6XZ21_BACIE|nr:LacI family DNA-binding transcriptional regulator [Salisediminibacterium selenitireducens]ADI00306.1 transcriptional regulator, LacI family [[Bacillus] selenitireducens MLS10]
MATIKEIARAAGVSHSTVSRALNDSPLIAEGTKEKIRQLASEMDFEVNHAARSLNRRVSNVIGIVTPPFFGDMKSELFFASLTDQLIRALQDEGYLIKMEYGGAENGRVRKLSRGRNVDGLIIIDKDLPKSDAAFLKFEQMPVVFLHYEPEQFTPDEVYLVKTDHHTGGFLAGEHLLENNRRRLMSLTAKDGVSIEYTERTDGFLHALKTHRAPDPVVLKTALSFHAAYETVSMTPAIAKREIDGLFAQTDIIALAAIEAMKDMGVRVPEEIAVVGYDNIEIGSYFKPHLTTIEQPVRPMVETACRLLLEQMSGKNPPFQHVRIKPTLIKRDSVVASS